MKMFYIAGPLFSDSEKRYLEGLVTELSKKLSELTTLSINEYDHFFLPHRDVGDAGVVKGGNEDIFIRDLEYLDEANIIIAWLDGADVDSGTAVELGYAYAKGKHIFALLTDTRRWHGTEIRGLNNMVWGVCKGEERVYRIDDMQEKNRLLEDISNVLREVKEVKLP